MANIFQTIEYINVVEPNKDFCSAFEKEELLDIKFLKVINPEKFRLFRGHNYLGFSVFNSLIYFIDTIKSEFCIKFDADIDLIDCSPDGKFIAVLLKSNYLCLVFTPKNEIMFKQLLKIKDKETVLDLKILNFNGTISEIWIFFNNSIRVFGNINFSEICKVYESSDKTRQSSLFKEIQIVERPLEYNEKNTKLINVTILKSKNGSQYLIGILTNNRLLAMMVNFSNCQSIISYIYETSLQDISIYLKSNSKASICFASDEMSVFILDDDNQLWICNFIIGVICGKLELNKNDRCMRFVNYLDQQDFMDMLVLVNVSDNNNLAYIDLICFPKMNQIESFPVASDCQIFPFSNDKDSIFILQSQKSKPCNVVLKRISRLDPKLKLSSIILSGNYDLARDFAITYGLDVEDIYVHQLRKLMESWELEPKLTKDKQINVLKCISELRTYFNFDLFVKLIVVTMSSFVHQKFFLTTLHKYIRKYRQLSDGDQLYLMINHEMEKFTIYCLMYQESNYTPEMWKNFRNLDNQSILFHAIQLENVTTLCDVWLLIEGLVDDVFSVNNDEFCENIKNKGISMINRFCELSELNRLFHWLTGKVIPRQIEICPAKLKSITDIIHFLVRKMEATHNKQYRLACLEILDNVITNLQSTSIQHHNTIMKANVITARLTSGLHNINPYRLLITLNNDLNQLERLYKNYNLDLNLEVLQNESGMNLAMRILDQTSNTELSTEALWDKLNSFLKEFEVRPVEFYYNYICQKLIHKVSFKLENVANDSSGEYSMIFNRFLVLLDKIEDKQLQLECLVSFASNVDVPFKEQLKVLIDKKILSSHHSNPAISKLKALQRKSIITPICNRYGKTYNQKVINPQQLLFVILKSETGASRDQCAMDIDCIMKEYGLDESVLIHEKCSFYIDEIFFQDESVSYSCYQTLLTYLNDSKSTKSFRNELLNFTFLRYRNLLMHIDEWIHDSLLFVTEVGLNLINKYQDNDIKWHWLEVFNTLKFCLKLRDLNGTDRVSVSELLGGEIGQYTISDLQWSVFRETIMLRYFKQQIMLHFENVKLKMACNLLQLKEDIVQSLKSKKILCTSSFNMKEVEFVKIIVSALVSVIQQLILSQKDQSFLGYAIYCSFEVILEFSGTSVTVIPYQSFEINKILSMLLQINIKSNVFVVFKILESCSKLIGLYIINNVKNLSKNFIYVNCVIRYITSVVRCFAYLEKPEQFSETKFFNKIFFQERPKSLDVIDNLIEFFRAAFVIVSGLDTDLESAIIKFQTECLKVLPVLLENHLYINGYLQGLSIISQNCKQQDTLLSLISFVNSRESVFISTWKFILKSRVIDTCLLSGLMFLCNPIVAQREIESLLRGCKKNRQLLLDLYGIGVIVLLKYKNHELPNRLKIYETMSQEVRKKFWTMKLLDYNISFKGSDEIDLASTKLEIFQHPKMTLDFVRKFLDDFQICGPVQYLEYFQGIFKNSFHDCNSFNSYKIQVENLLVRAEEIWMELPETTEYFKAIDKALFLVKGYVNPYHYEIFEYLYGKLVITDLNYQPELDMLKLLHRWKRVSPVGEQELLLCQSLVEQFHMPNPSQAEYLSCRRLPYHIVLEGNPLGIIGSELNDTNVHLWQEMYEIINRVRYIDRSVFNKDLLQEITVKNQLKDFIDNHNLTNNDPKKRHVFMGNLYQTSSSWFVKTVNNMLLVLDDILMNATFISIVKDFMSYLVVGEQLIYIMNKAISWIDNKLAREICTSRKELSLWRNQIFNDLQNIKIEEVFFQYNFNYDEYLNIISEDDQRNQTLLELILDHERLKMKNMSTKRLNDVTTILIKVAKIINHDIGEFSCSYVRARLKLNPPIQDMSLISDGDMSILNTTGDISIDESRIDRIYEDYIDFNELEILSQDKTIKSSIRDNLLKYLEENTGSPDQLNNVFQFLFRIFRPSEDQFIDRICNNHWYSSFLIFMELYALNLQKYSTNELSGVEYLIQKRVREFCLQDKTDLVKQLLLCGESIQHGSNTKCMTNRSISLVKDIITTYPETIDMKDPQIANIVQEKIYNEMSEEMI